MWTFLRVLEQPALMLSRDGLALFGGRVMAERITTAVFSALKY